MLRFLKGFFAKPTPPNTETPSQLTTELKIEGVGVVNVEDKPKCGCGRSQNGFCVGLHKLTAEEWSTHKDNPTAAKPAPAKKRTFKKREEGGTAKVAKIKAPPKPKAVPKPRTPK
jgi:CDGSH-type Zn-finger protein